MPDTTTLKTLQADQWFVDSPELSEFSVQSFRSGYANAPYDD